MLATLTDAPFDSRDWVFETKWDGYRIVARIQKGSVTLYSRSGFIVSDNYKPVAKVLKKIKHDAVIDGELVAVDEKGFSRFQLLQNALNTAANLKYCAFDIMFLDGKDLRALPLVERKRRLQTIVPKHPLLLYSDHWTEHGKQAFKEAQRLGLEGIVGKRATSRYHSGVRTREWLKIKTVRRQEAVIVGFTKPQGSRAYFGALVLAVRAGKRWRYVGHVGTGFSYVLLKDLHARMQSLIISSSPFNERVRDEVGITWLRITSDPYSSVGETVSQPKKSAAMRRLRRFSNFPNSLITTYA